MSIRLLSCIAAVVGFSVVACSAPTSDEIPSDESQATSGLNGASAGGGTGCATPECTKSECGPGPLVASRLCSDGSTAGPTCARSAKGTCGWSITSCPTEPPTPVPPPAPVPAPKCGLDSCSGPRPLTPTLLCKDGSTAGPTCEATASGACGWVITSCP